MKKIVMYNIKKILEDVNLDQFISNLPKGLIQISVKWHRYFERNKKLV